MSSNVEESTSLTQIACHRLSHPADLLAYSPAHDLVAFSIPSERCLAVYQLNGERAFSVSVAENDSKIHHLAWRDDGRVIALVTSCSTVNAEIKPASSISSSAEHGNHSGGIAVRLVDVFSGKVVHKFNFTSTTAFQPLLSATTSAFRMDSVRTRKVSCLGWSTSAKHLDPTASVGFATLQQTKHLSVPDLPHNSMVWDAESSLPKVSTLQATGGEDDVFSTRASIDAIFHPQERGPGLVQHEADQGLFPIDTGINFLLIGFDDGTVHLRIFDSFQVGSLALAGALPAEIASDVKTIRPIRCISSPAGATQIVVVELTDNAGHLSVHMIAINVGSLSQILVSVPSTPMTLPLHLPILITKVTQLQNLQRYLTQAQSQLQREVQNAFDLPGKWLHNIYETLAESETLSSSQPMTAPTPDVQERLLRGKALFEAHITALIATGECDMKLREWMADELGERNIIRWEKAVAEGLELIRRGLEERVLPALERCLVVVSRLMGLALASKAASAEQGFGLSENVLRSTTGLLNAMTLVAHDAMKAVSAESQGFSKWISWLRWCTEVEQCETEDRKEEVREGGAEGLDWLAVLQYLRGGLTGLRLSTLVGSGETKSGLWRHWDEARLYDEYKAARRDGKPTPGIDWLMGKLAPLCADIFDGIAESLKKSVRMAYSGRLDSGGTTTIDGKTFWNNDTGHFNAHLVATTQPGKYLDQIHLELGRGQNGGEIRRQTLSDTHSKTTDLKMVDQYRALQLTTNDALIVWHLCQSNPAKCSVVESGRRGAIEAMAVSGRKGRSVVCLLSKGGRVFEVLDLESTVRECVNE